MPENTDRAAQLHALLQERDPHFKQGLPRILVCSDSVVLPTGLSRVVRGIMEPLHQTDKYCVIQHAWFHVGGKEKPVSFELVPVRRAKQDPMHFSDEDKYGVESFDGLIEIVQPQIVFVVGDYNVYEHIRKSRHRAEFQLMAYLPLDTFPPAQSWVDCAKDLDQVVYYTDFAAHWGTKAGAPGISIPHGIDPNLFQPLDSDARTALRTRSFKSDDIFLIGTVGRNQIRKRLDLVIELVAHLRKGAYSRCGHCQHITPHTYLVPESAFEFDDTLSCEHCRHTEWTAGKAWEDVHGYLHVDPDENPNIPLKALIQFWNVSGSVHLNDAIKISYGHGLPDNILAQLYQCMDLYMHPATGGGWELPPLEAAASGLPIVAADAPAQNEWLRKLPGVRLVPGEVQWDNSCAGYRVYANIAGFIEHVLPLLEDREAAKAAGERNQEAAQEYDWTKIAMQWEAAFDQLLDPDNQVPGWTILREV